MERRHPEPPRATARKLSRPQRSLRAQDRSRGARPNNAPKPSPSEPVPHHLKISKSGPFCVNVRDRPPGARSGSGNGPEQALEAINPSPRAQRESPTLPRASLRAQDRSRGAPVETLIPSASTGTRPLQNRCEHPGVCGVPSERSGCTPYPGFHPGLVYDAPLGHSERLTFPEPSCADLIPQSTPKYTKPHRDRDGASTGSDQPLPRAQRENPILPRASLRAQDRSRGARPKNAPKPSHSEPVPHHLKICKSAPFCVNVWDRPHGDDRCSVEAGPALSLLACSPVPARSSPLRS